MSQPPGLWPAALGCPLRAGYAGQADPIFSTTEVADGPPRHRILSTDERRRWSVEFVWTQAQVQVFESWVATDLRMGLLWFRMDQLTGGGMSEHFCHLVGDYTLAPADDSPVYWSCAFEVEAFSRWPEDLPPLELLDPIDGGSVGVILPADVIDGWLATEPAPADRTDALAPGT